MPDARTRVVTVSFDVESTYCPVRLGTGRDARDLGFALIATGCLPVPHSHKHPKRQLRRAGLRIAFEVLALLDRTTDLLKPYRHCRCLPEPATESQPGCSVIIPERGNVALLETCLSALSRSVARVDEPIQVIVVANGSPPEHYFFLHERFPSVLFQIHPAPLSFRAAIELGLQCTLHDWVYLLNNDMAVEEDTLREVLRWRAPDIFSVASQIFMQDTTNRVETNWTDFTLTNGLVELWDAEPENTDTVQTSLYAGGGSSLFQARLLRAALRETAGYDPFYWEDVEWGVLALRHGYQNLFCPQSRVRHRHRATVRKYYPEQEIERIFQRNRILFQLRQLKDSGSLEAVQSFLQYSDGRTCRELFALGRLLEMLRARWRGAFLPYPENAIFGTRRPYRVPELRELTLVPGD